MAELIFPTYEISQPRGYGLIIVNLFEQFKVAKREGAQQEIDNLKNLFESLGLKPVVYTELTKQKIQELLQLTSQSPELKEHSMIAVAISSHGGEAGLYGTDYDENNPNTEEFAISPKAIKGYFNSKNCPLLDEKPKLFFLNGCRGSDKEVAHYTEGKADGPEADGPDESDFLTLHSTVSGHVSMRDTKSGSIFIDILCEVLLKYNGHDIAQLIPVINGELMKRSARTEEIEGQYIKLTETCIADLNLSKMLCLARVPASGGVQQS